MVAIIVNGNIVTLFFEKEKINMKRVLNNSTLLSALSSNLFVAWSIDFPLMDAMYDLLAFIRSRSMILAICQDPDALVVKAHLSGF